MEYYTVMSRFHLSYLKEKGIAWFNPCGGLIGFWKEYNSLRARLNKPHEYVWGHRDLKRAKEIYAISIIAKAMEGQNGTGQWWIMKPKNDPPDGVIGTLIARDGGQWMHVREVEVVEHIDGDILDTIRTKLAGKQYEPNTVLVCYLSQGGFPNLEEVAEVISKEITSLEHIFLVFPGTKLSDIPADAVGDDFLKAVFKVSSVQIKPAYSFKSISLIDDCKNWRDGKEPNFQIFEGIGRGGSRPITLENPPRLF
jgi:hypothetical protein